MKEKKTNKGCLAEIVMPKIEFSKAGSTINGRAVIGHWLDRHGTIAKSPTWEVIVVPIGSIVMVIQPRLGEILFEGKLVIVPKQCIRRIDETESW